MCQLTVKVGDVGAGALEGVDRLEGTVVSIGRVRRVGGKRVTNQVVASDGGKAGVVVGQASGRDSCVEVAHQVDSAVQPLGDGVTANDQRRRCSAWCGSAVTGAIGEQHGTANQVVGHGECSDATTGDHIRAIDHRSRVIEEQSCGGGARLSLGVSIGAVGIQN